MPLQSGVTGNDNNNNKTIMNNFLRKLVMFVLLVVGWTGGAWADDAGSTAVVEVLDANGNKTEYTDFSTALTDAKDGRYGTTWTIRCLTDLKTLLPLIFYNTSSEEDMSATLDLNGHEILKGDNTYIIIGNYNKTSKFKLTIKDGATGGKFSFKYAPVMVYSGNEIEFASGTYDVDDIRMGGKLTISGGKLSFDKLETLSAGTPQKENINVTGGLIKENDANQTLRQLIDEDNYKAVENASTGDYYAVVPTNTVAMNYDADGNLSGMYTTFEDATSLSNLSDGTTIRLCADCAVSSKCYIEGGIRYSKGVCLDLNGYELKGSLGVSKNGFVIIVDESASQSGKITYSHMDMIDIASGGTLNIFGGNFISTYGVMFFNSGNINIYGGNFSYDSWLTTALDNNSTLSIYGGFFNKNTIEGNDENHYWTKYIADGFMVIDNSDVEGYSYAVVQIGANLTYGDGTTAKAPIYNGLTLDLKDDESDHNAWVSKIDVDNDVENVDVTVKKTFNTNWQAFYAPFQINVTDELLQSFDVAKIWDTELNTNDNSTLIEFIQLKDGQSIPAFTPCLIKAKATGKQDIVFKNVTVKATNTAVESIECSNVDESFTFTGVMENTSLTGHYALDSETGALVHLTSTTAQVTPMKFFMTVESKTPATSIKSKRFAVRVIGDETTGISTINGGNAANVDATVYNLQGVKVGTSTTCLPTGIYIQNGRKVVVK